MRAAPLALTILLVTAAGSAAQTTSFESRDNAMSGRTTARLRLPQSDEISYRPARPSDDSDIPIHDQRESRFDGASQSVVSVGSFKLGMDSDGPRKHFARVELEDAHILGGNISGTFDGRGGQLRLSWPTGH